MSDLEFAQRCTGGDKAAWEEFVSRYTRLIFHSIRKVFSLYAPGLLSQHHLIEDLSHDVLILLLKDDFRKLKTYQARQGASLAGWLRQVAVNYTIDHLRRSVPEFSLDQEDEEGLSLEERLPAPSPSSAHLLEEKERQELLAGCIAQLDAEARFFLDLAIAYHIAPEEMANLLGISRGAVDMRKSRIMERLKECLRKKGFALD